MVLCSASSRSAQDVQAVDLRGQARCDRGLINGAGGGDVGGGARGVGVRFRGQPQLAQEAPALVQGVDVRVHRLDILQARPRHRQQVVVHPLEVLGDDLEAGVGMRW